MWLFVIFTLLSFFLWPRHEKNFEIESNPVYTKVQKFLNFGCCNFDHDTEMRVSLYSFHFYFYLDADPKSRSWALSELPGLSGVEADFLVGVTWLRWLLYSPKTKLALGMGGGGGGGAGGALVPTLVPKIRKQLDHCWKRNFRLQLL